MSYESFSYYYDSLMDESFYDDYAKFIKDHIVYNNVLELGCGSGELALKLVDNANSYVASDYSRTMLEVFSNKITLNSNIQLKNIDMVDFESDSDFDFVLCACDSINYIIEKQDVIKVFKNVYNALKNNGYFIFDIDSIYKMDIILNGYHETDEDDDYQFEWRCEHVCSGEVKHYIHIHDKLNNEIIDEVHHQKSYPIDTYIHLLESIGFKNIQCYYDFESQTNDKAERIIFITQK